MDFERAFDQFIDRSEYDSAENALFSMVRAAFQAGWLAAGGDPPPARPVFRLIQCASGGIRGESVGADVGMED